MNIEKELKAAKARGLEEWRKNYDAKRRAEDDDYNRRFAERATEVIEFIRTEVLPEVQRCAADSTLSRVHVPVRKDMDDALVKLVVETLHRSGASCYTLSYKEGRISPPNGETRFFDITVL